MQVRTIEDQNRERLFTALKYLLGLDISQMDHALNAAAEQIAQAMRADKVDIFVYEREQDVLRARGTNNSAMARKQRALGLDCLPRMHGGMAGAVFETGKAQLTGHLDQNPHEVPGIITQLGVRSQIAVPLTMRSQRHGALMVCSATPEYFNEDDLHFVASVASWVGLISYRAAALSAEQREREDRATRLSVETTLSTLTPRQREVAILVGAGLSNNEIASQLVLSPGTVANHVEAILRKLGYRSRAQIAALVGPSEPSRP